MGFLMLLDVVLWFIYWPVALILAIIIMIGISIEVGRENDLRMKLEAAERERLRPQAEEDQKRWIEYCKLKGIDRCHWGGNNHNG